MSLVDSVLPSSGDAAASAVWLAPEQNGDAIMAGPTAYVFATALLAFYALTGASYWNARPMRPTAGARARRS
jgi:hypothetical protein